MGAFSYNKFIISLLDRWKVYNRLVFACTVKTAIKIKRQCVLGHRFICNNSMVLISKTRRSCLVSSFLIVFLFACSTSNQANLAFKTTIIEDTHLTLAAFQYKVEANNSLIFLPLQTFAEFLFLLSL